jgi:hypothetical protein
MSWAERDEERRWHAGMYIQRKKRFLHKVYQKMKKRPFPRVFCEKCVFLLEKKEEKAKKH